MEKGLPKITFGIIVLNGEPFTKYCLRSLYPFAHEIIVVEGGSWWARDQAPEGHSTDGTLEALYEFKDAEDPGDKLQIITREGFWSEKHEQSQAYAERATGDYLWQVDIDEFYKPEDMDRVLWMLKENPSITAMSFLELCFWGSFHSTLHGWYSWGDTNEYHRLFKYGDGYKYVTHRPPTVVDYLGRDTRSLHWLRGRALAKQGILLYHYAYVFPKQVRNKAWYHWRRDPRDAIRFRDWYEDNYQHLSRPLYVYEDQSRPNWLRRFTGDHPPQISLLISDIERGEISVEPRPQDDIDAVLDSLPYRVKTLVLHSISAPCELLLSKLPRHVAGSGLWRWMKRMGSLCIGLLPGLLIGNWWRYRYNRLVHNSRILLNVNHADGATRARRALLVYMVLPFVTDHRSPAFVFHQNMWTSVELARLLDKLGYVVDAMDWDDYESAVDAQYDLLIGFGRADELAKQLPPQTIKLHLATGPENNAVNRSEKERVAQVNARRGCNLAPVRPQLDSSGSLRYYDAAACLGNEVTVATYRPFFEKRIYALDNHGYDHLFGLPEGKDFETSRRSFLFFGAAGQVLNGLDLLLEIFLARPHLNLCVCGLFEKERDFVECYRKELYDTPNIHPVGWVRVGSARYMELVKECGMVIQPTAAAGSPGSVVICMGKGLIPIVSREAGIDTADFGITLPSCGIEDIEKVVDWISSQPAQWHEEMSHKVLNAARTDFSQEAFSRRWREILRQVTARQRLIDGDSQQNASGSGQVA